MDPSAVQAGGGGGVMVWGIFSWHTLDPLVTTEHRLIKGVVSTYILTGKLFLGSPSHFRQSVL